MERAADTALNGAQVQAAQDVISSVAARELPRETGVAMLVEFFNIDAARAEKVMGPVGRTFFATQEESNATSSARPQV